MQHADHVSLIRPALEGAGPRWLELGAATGSSRSRLADLLGRPARSPRWIGTAGSCRARAGYRGALRHARHDVAADFTGTATGPFDGVLAATASTSSPTPGRLAAIHAALAPGGRLVLVEYDADHGNP